MKRPRRSGSSGAVPASAAIAAALSFHGIADEVHAGRVITEWSELVGSRIAQRTRPDGVFERVLWVEVASSAWLHELTLLRPQLLKGLLERLGGAAPFSDLKFRLAGRQRRAPVMLRAPGKPPPPPRSTPIPATGTARDRIVREVDVVDDAELRALICRVRIAHDR